MSNPEESKSSLQYDSTPATLPLVTSMVDHSTSSTVAESVGTSPVAGQLIPVESICYPSFRSRRNLDMQHLTELMESIAKDGLLQPIVVRLAPPSEAFKYILVAGEHRLSAVDALGWKEIPALVLDCDERRAETAFLVENLKRLNFKGKKFDEAVTRLLELEGKEPGTQPAKRGRPQKNSAPRTSITNKAAKELGVSSTKVIRARLRSERSAPEVREALDAGKLTASQVDELVKLDPEVQREMLPEIIGRGRAETRAIVKKRQAAKHEEEHLNEKDSSRLQDEPVLTSVTSEAYDQSKPAWLIIVEFEMVAEEFVKVTTALCSLVTGDTGDPQVTESESLKSALRQAEGAFATLRAQIGIQTQVGTK